MLCYRNPTESTNALATSPTRGTAAPPPPQAAGPKPPRRSGTDRATGRSSPRPLRALQGVAREAPRQRAGKVRPVQDRAARAGAEEDVVGVVPAGAQREDDVPLPNQSSDCPFRLRSPGKDAMINLFFK